MFKHALNSCLGFCIYSVSGNSLIRRIGSESSGYGVLLFNSSWFLVKCVHIYAVSSLMDMTYRASYARAMVELRADVELKYAIVVVVPKFVDDDELGTNEEGDLKLVEKGGNSGVVSSAHDSSLVASDSPNTTPLTKRINNLERQMLNGKLMLVDDDGNPLNKVDYDPINADSDSDVEVAYDETLNSWLLDVQMMQAYTRTMIMTSIILMILKV
nr:hypothetical protein [Tanacetum cinerariifolium]